MQAIKYVTFAALAACNLQMGSSTTPGPGPGAGPNQGGEVETTSRPAFGAASGETIPTDATGVVVCKDPFHAQDPQVRRAHNAELMRRLPQLVGKTYVEAKDQIFAWQKEIGQRYDPNSDYASVPNCAAGLVCSARLICNTQDTETVDFVVGQ